MSSGGGERNQCSSSRQSRKRLLEPNEDQKSDIQPAKYRMPNGSAGARTMLNQIVLAKVAKELPAGTLLQLRSTCTSLSSQFVPQLKKVHSHLKLLAYGTELTPEETNAEGDFTDVARASADHPFAKFQFMIHEEGDDDEKLGLERVHLFTREFGRNVTSLTIVVSGDTDFSISQLRTMIMDDLPCLAELIFKLDGCGPTRPSTPTPTPEPTHEGEEEANGMKLLPLKLLNVEIAVAPHYETPGVNQDFAQLLCDVIRRANGLEELVIIEQLHYHEQADLVRQMLTGLLHSGHVNSLKELRLPTPSALKLSDLQILVQLGTGGLRLDSFHACVSCQISSYRNRREGRDYLRLVHEFLATQSSTLKTLTLKLGIFEDEEHHKCCVPRLERLKELQIEDSSLRPDELQFSRKPSRTLRQAFPRLTTFSYTNDVEEDYGVKLSDDLDRLFNPGVKCLKLTTDMAKCDLFQSFAFTFPSIAVLDLTLASRKQNRTDNLIDVKKFGPKLWTTWPGLTNIRIHIDVARGLDFDLDSLLSGVPRVDLERLRRQFDPTQGDLSLASLRQRVQKYKTRPGISDLRHLREFSISPYETETWVPELTDIGCYFGFALSSLSLQRIVIRGLRLEEKLVSEQCLDFLRHTFGPAVEIRLEIYPSIYSVKL